MYCYKQMVQLGGGHIVDAGAFVLLISKRHNQLQFISPILFRKSSVFTNIKCGLLASLQRQRESVTRLRKVSPNRIFHSLTI